MPTIGPIPLNGGWVSDSDFWNPPPNGGAITYQMLQPYANGARTFDGPNAIGQTTTHAQISGLLYWQDPAQIGTANRDILIATVSSKVYTSPRNSIVWTDRTGATTVQSQNFYTFDVLNAIVIMANGGNVGTTAPLKITAWNTNAAALAGSPPNCNIVLVVNGFAFMAQNMSAAGLMSRLYWSNVSDPETWSASNFVDVNKSDGEPITALSSIGNDVIIFKLNSISRFTANPISGTNVLGPLTQVSDQIGCMGTLCVDKLPDGTIVFLGSDRHLYRFDGVAFEDLSNKPFPQSNIRSTQDPISSSSTSFSSYPLYGSCIKVDSSRNRIFVVHQPASGTGQVFPTYTYDFLQRSWSDWTNWNDATEACFYMSIVPSNNNATAFGALNKSITFGSNSGTIYQPTWASQLFSFNSTTVASCVFETSILLGGQVPATFYPRSVVIPFRQPTTNTGGTITVNIGFDGSYKSSAEYSGGFSTAPFNLKIPIKSLVNSTFSHPRTMQVKITLSPQNGNVLGNTIIEPFFISDEVLT